MDGVVSLENDKNSRQDDDSTWTDDDNMSVMSMTLNGCRQIRKSSINYENPDLVRLLKSSQKPGDQQLSALSEDSAQPKSASRHLFLNTVEDEKSQHNEEQAIVDPGVQSSGVVAATESIAEMFKNNDTGTVSVRRFLNALTANGVRTSDPRLNKSMYQLKRIMRRYGADFEAAGKLSLDEHDFKEAIKEDAMTISRFLRSNFAIPEWTDFCRHMFRIYALCKGNDGGAPSNFIPQLAAYDKDLWGVSVCSVDGQRFSTGDSNVPFCLQAVSWVMNYVMALNDLGEEKVHSYVGLEPSGRSATALALDENNKPHNPMINAGAIVVTSLLKEQQRHMAERFQEISDVYAKMVGGEYIGFCNTAYLSERQISYQNFALGYLLRENKCLPDGDRLNETMELMLQLGSIEVTCESLSVMAATLANGGVCPITGEYVIGSHCVRNVLSLMYTTGMNEYSGQFAFHIGLPAKSAISGAIVLVVPNVLGICVWSPSVDHHGNSIRGIQFCRELVRTFNFHNYDNLRFTQRKLDPRKMNVETKAHQVVLTLFSAANGDVTALTRFYLQGVDLTVADYDRRTPLHVAAAEGHTQCVQFLIEKARVPCRPIDRWNNTPADDARYHGHSEVANYLENWDMRRSNKLPVPALPSNTSLVSLPSVPAAISDAHSDTSSNSRSSGNNPTSDEDDSETPSSVDKKTLSN